MNRQDEEAVSKLINYTEEEVDLLARLMRAEALGEGELGMLMVGNVVVNRVISTCYSFKDIDTIKKAIYQMPGGFAGINTGLFKEAPSSEDKELALSCLNGDTFYPATHALWFYAPKKEEDCLANWLNQINAGRYKSHCFYRPDPGACPNLY